MFFGEECARRSFEQISKLDPRANICRTRELVSALFNAQEIEFRDASDHHDIPGRMLLENALKEGFTLRIVYQVDIRPAEPMGVATHAGGKSDLPLKRTVDHGWDEPVDNSISQDVPPSNEDRAPSDRLQLTYVGDGAKCFWEVEGNEGKQVYQSRVFDSWKEAQDSWEEAQRESQQCVDECDAQQRTPRTNLSNVDVIAEKAHGSNSQNGVGAAETEHAAAPGHELGDPGRPQDGATPEGESCPTQIDPMLRRAIEELNKLRTRDFIWVGYFVNSLLPNMGLTGGEAQILLNRMRDEGVISLEERPNPNNPERPAKHVQLSRDHPLVEAILTSPRPSGTFSRPRIQLPPGSEPVSETLIRERR